MIREDRDPTFWREVCEPGLDLSFLSHPCVRPLRSVNGGYLLVRLDALGRVWDLHAAYLPEGRGREAHASLKAVLRDLDGWELINVSEDAANPSSRPPLSFGFRPAGPARDGYRTWFLSRNAWAAAPASQRSH